MKKIFLILVFFTSASDIYAEELRCFVSANTGAGIQILLLEKFVEHDLEGVFKDSISKKNRSNSYRPTGLHPNSTNPIGANFDPLGDRDNFTFTAIGTDENIQKFQDEMTAYIDEYDKPRPVDSEKMREILGPFVERIIPDPIKMLCKKKTS